MTGAIVISLGVITAVVYFARSLMAPQLTSYNYFLSREMREARTGIAADTPPAGTEKRGAKSEAAVRAGASNAPPMRRRVKRRIGEQ